MISLLSSVSYASLHLCLVSAFSGELIVSCDDRTDTIACSLGAFLMGEGREYIYRRWLGIILTHEIQRIYPGTCG